MRRTFLTSTPNAGPRRLEEPREPPPGPASSEAGQSRLPVLCPSIARCLSPGGDDPSRCAPAPFKGAPPTKGPGSLLTGGGSENDCAAARQMVGHLAGGPRVQGLMHPDPSAIGCAVAPRGRAEKGPKDERKTTACNEGGDCMHGRGMREGGGGLLDDSRSGQAAGSPPAQRATPGPPRNELSNPRTACATTPGP